MGTIVLERIFISSMDLKPRAFHHKLNHFERLKSSSSLQDFIKTWYSGYGAAKYLRVVSAALNRILKVSGNSF
jgi:hypothetical protein